MLTSAPGIFPVESSGSSPTRRDIREAVKTWNGPELDWLSYETLRISPGHVDGFDSMKQSNSSILKQGLWVWISSEKWLVNPFF